MEEDKNMLYTIILRHDTSTNWMINNPILALGEYGVEDDTHRIKRGNGEDSWENLQYEHFGLEYIVTFANLLGSVEDNEALKIALDSKLGKDILQDAQNSILTGFKASSQYDYIGKFTITIKNISTGLLSNQSLIIASNDGSVQGNWNVNDLGEQILNLKAVTKIDVFTPFSFYAKDQLCIYGNKLYKSKKDFTAKQIFDVNDWAILTSLLATDILFEHNSGLLVSNNVQDAIDELARITNGKLTKTDEINKLYGTDKNGFQILYDKDSLRTVDSVNTIKPDENKNIQIDSSNINYDDKAEHKQTIKQILDSKVDKNVAGEGNKIVQTASFELNESDGTITFKTKNLSLVDGTTEDISNKINIVSESELSNKLQELNSNISNEFNTNLNKKIDKDIASNLVTDVNLSTAPDSSESIIQIILKNPDTKEQSTKNIGFISEGNIKISNDLEHIIINSSDIDALIQANADHLSLVDTKLQNIETDITSLQQHDVNHESILSTHTAQIADHETKILSNEAAINDLKSKAVVYNDERNIDIENNIALKKNMMLTGATPTQYYNLASMRTYNEGELNELVQTEYGTTKVHMNLNSLDRPSIELPSSEKHLIAYKEELDLLTETVNSNHQTLLNDKLDKSFTANLLNNLSYEGPADVQLLKINKTDINPVDNITADTSFVIKSSDNTLIAKPLMQEDKLIGIDISTNLDVDVNYFITSEVLNTTIPSDNTVTLSSLTATDKPDLEIYDIISDSEGTWARVKSINKEEGTCIAVTFHKHAQAVWGTIKGTISNQADLQEAFNTKIDKSKFTYPIILNDLELADMPDKTSTRLQGTVFNAATQTSEIVNLINLSSSNGMIKFNGNNSQKVPALELSIDTEKLPFNAQESGITSDNISQAIRELKQNINTLDSSKLNKALFDTNKLLCSPIELSEQEENNIKISYKEFNTNDSSFADKQILIKSSKNLSITTEPDSNSIDINLDTSKVLVSTQNENEKDIVSAVQDLYKLPRIVSYETLANGFEMKPGMITYMKDNTNNVAYLVICIVGFTISDQPSLQDNFNTNISNGNLLRIGIPNEIL